MVIVVETTGHKSSKQVRLEKARTVAEARFGLQDLQKDRREENLTALKRSPKWADYWGGVFQILRNGVGRD